VFGYAGPIYGVSAVVLGGWFLVLSLLLLLDKQDALGISLTKDKPARRTFRYSLSYLFVLFFALAVDHFAW
jgi:protoheme IX farnesyltransferase